MKTSTVDFPTLRRVHLAIEVSDLDASIAFYKQLFDQEPTKTRSDYAKFEVAEPPINFTLNATNREIPSPPASQHFGIQLKDTDALQAVYNRAEAAGVQTRTEDEKTCCYAVADKVWLRDPDGHNWEIFVTLTADVAVHSIPEKNSNKQDPACCTPEQAPKAESQEDPCCAPACCS